MTFVVENNVPVAKKAMSRRRSPLRTAISGLKIGQCVTVFTEEEETLKALRARVSGLVNGAKKDTEDLELVQRTVEARRTEEGQLEKAIRVWRVDTLEEEYPGPTSDEQDPLVNEEEEEDWEEEDEDDED